MSNEDTFLNSRGGSSFTVSFSQTNRERHAGSYDTPRPVENKDVIPLRPKSTADSVFSVTSYLDEDALPRVEPILRVYEEPLPYREDVSSPREEGRSEGGFFAKETKETVYNLRGEPGGGLPSLGDPDNLARTVYVSGWPREVTRLLSRGEEAFDHLSGIIQCQMMAETRMLGFGAAKHRVGCSTLVLALAHELVCRHCSVLLVDASFDSPALAQYFGIELSSGWEKLLSQRDGVPPGGLLKIQFSNRGACSREMESLRGGGVFLLPLSPKSVSDAYGASCRQIWLARLLELAESFDVVLVDHGVTLSSDDRHKTEEMLRFGCDGWYLVDDARSGTPEAALGIIEQTALCDLPCLGRIENFV